MLKKYILPIIILSIFFCVNSTNANLIPWTIQKTAQTNAWTCNYSTPSYNPTGFSCYTSSECQVDLWNSWCVWYWTPDTCDNSKPASGWVNAVPDTCDNSVAAHYSNPGSPATYTCACAGSTALNPNNTCYCNDYVAPSGWVNATPDTCDNSAPWYYSIPAVPDTCNNSVQTNFTCSHCIDWYTVPSTSWSYWPYYSYTSTLNVTSWLSNLWYNATVKLWVDSNRTCRITPTWTSNTPPSWVTTTTCEKYNTSYYTVPWSNWTCTMSSWDYLISSYNQLWTVNFNDNSNIDSNWTCTVEWRFANADYSWPPITINAPVFNNNNNDQWCNINKYRNYASYSWSQNPGCQFYKTNNGQDMLYGMTIDVWYDVSWIWSVEIQLWTCNYTYTSFSNSLTEIVNFPYSTSGWWVKSTYTSAFTIWYNTSVYALWKTQPSLLSAFGKTRLDECLWEWNNRITVLAKDMARDEYYWIYLAPNIYGPVSTAWTINIDNSGPKVGVTWDLQKTELTVPSWFLNAINFPNFRNFSLIWNIQSVEKYGDWPHPPCLSFTTFNDYCSPPILPINSIRRSPVWVNPTTWYFSWIDCDWVRIPNKANDCGWECKTGYYKNTFWWCSIIPTCSSNQVFDLVARACVCVSPFVTDPNNPTQCIDPTPLCCNITSTDVWSDNSNVIWSCSICWPWAVVTTTPPVWPAPILFAWECDNTTSLWCIAWSPINDNGASTCWTTRTWNCSWSNALNNSVQCSRVNTNCNSNPSNLNLSHSTRSKTFTFSWTAWSWNWWSCKLQYYKNWTTWTDISTTTYNCDSNLSNQLVNLPWDWWNSWNWNWMQIRIIRTNDSTVVGTFAQNLTCNSVSGSSSSTPNIDEDCNGSWDNLVGGNSIPWCQSWYKCMSYYSAPWSSYYACYWPPTPTWMYSCRTISTSTNVCISNCGICNDWDTNVWNSWRDTASTNCSYSGQSLYY